MTDTDRPQLDDRPAPGWDRLLLLAGLSALFIYLAFFSGSARSESTGFFGIIFPLLVMLGFIPLAYSSLVTRYRLFPDRLEMKSGFFNGTVYFNEIRDIHLVRFIFESKQVTFTHRTFCNRQFNGLKIKTYNRTFLITPSDPEAFLSRLKKLSATGKAT